MLPWLTPPEFDTVMVPELVMEPVAEMLRPVLIPALDMVMEPELEIGLDNVTVTPLGIILLSDASGTVPLLQVLPVFQSPLATAVIVAACAS